MSAIYDENLASPAFREFAVQLSRYMVKQKTDDDRRAKMPNPPWPEQDNVMLGYLIQRALEISSNDGLSVALLWLATHSWFEGALAERDRVRGQ